MNNTDPVSQPALGALSVREICEFELLKQTRVLAGERGIERRVLRLNVMSVPDVVEWTKPHELLLTTHYPLARCSEAMVRLLRDLDERGVAALVVKLGGETGLLDDAALRIADELAFPLLTVPDDVAFDDILSEVLAALTNRQAAALRRVQDVHGAMLRQSLDGGGVDDIVRELSRALGDVGVAFVDRGGSLVAECMNDEQWDYLRHRGIERDGHSLNRAAGLAAREEGTIAGLRAASVATGAVHQGYLVAVSSTATFDEEIDMMVLQAAMVAAFNVSKDIAVGAVSRRFEAAAIHGLLVGTEKEIEEIALRSDAFEWDLDRPLVVLAARHESVALQPGEQIRREHDVGAWLSAVRSVDQHAAAGMLGRNLVAVCGA
ncbi:MAG: PucR family transcriptional regulator ligand-binding domain-containing protein, partial [Nocardioidaceae bacterium]